MYLYGLCATAGMFALAHCAARGRVPYSSLSVLAICFALTGALIGTLLIVQERSIEAAAQATVLAACAAAAATDISTGYVFDVPLLTALCITLVMRYAAGGALDAAAGGALCAALFGALYGLTRGRGIGLGDVKLAGLIGCGLGLSASLHTLQIAFVAGGAVASWKLLAGAGRRGDTMPFGPYLAGSAAWVSVAGMLR